MLGLCVRAHLCHSVLSAHSFFCVLCCRSGDADVSGEGVGIETPTLFIPFYNKPLLHVTFLLLVTGVTICYFICQSVSFHNQIIIHSVLFVILVLLSRLNALIYSYKVFAYKTTTRVIKNKHPVSTNFSPNSRQLKIQPVINLFAAT